jgi:hypothetical protein
VLRVTSDMLAALVSRGNDPYATYSSRDALSKRSGESVSVLIDISSAICESVCVRRVGAGEMND